jgi:hypothetical protein
MTLCLIPMVFACLVTSMPQTLWAQTTPSIRWSVVTIDRAVRSSAPGEFIMFVPQREMEVHVALGIQGPRVFGLSDIASQIRVSVATDGAVMATEVRGRYQPPGFPAVPPPAPSTLEEGRGIDVRLVVSRSDGQVFGDGVYTITTDISDLFGGLTFENGSCWNGRAKTNDIRTVVIRPVATTQDRIQFHDSEGNYEFGKHNYAAAIPHLEALVALVPERWPPQATLGAAYVQLGRYVQAVAVLERAMPGWMKFRERRSDFVPNHLAVAYLALGREFDAARALRSGGVAEADIPERLDRLRPVRPRE